MIRGFSTLALAVALAGIGLAAPASAQAPKKADAVKGTAATAPKDAAFTLPALPYAPDALEPAIDGVTMTIHHGFHHQAYITALNNAVAAAPELQGQPLEALVAKAGTLSTAIRNNAGGHWNHSFFWKSMTPPAQSGQPSAELLKAITAKWGSLDNFKKEFQDAGLKRFGSGWVWLILDNAGNLAITSTPNQDNPLMDVAEVKGAPLLGNDVWEHAYYLKYQNKRGDYLSNWWQVVNWQKVSERFAKSVR